MKSDYIALTKTYPAKHLVYINCQDIVAFGPNLTEEKGVLGSVAYVTSGTTFYVAEDSETIWKMINET